MVFLFHGFVGTLLGWEGEERGEIYRANSNLGQNQIIDPAGQAGTELEISLRVRINFKILNLASVQRLTLPWYIMVQTFNPD